MEETHFVACGAVALVEPGSCFCDFPRGGYRLGDVGDVPDVAAVAGAVVGAAGGLGLLGFGHACCSLLAVGWIDRESCALELVKGVLPVLAYLSLSFQI